jgi:hypothetical protein
LPLTGCGKTPRFLLCAGTVGEYNNGKSPRFC